MKQDLLYKKTENFNKGGLKWGISINAGSGMRFSAVAKEVKKNSLLFRLDLAILCYLR